MNPYELAIDVSIKEWGPANIARIPSIREKLRPDIEGHSSILNALDLLEQTYLKPGYQEYMHNLVPRENIVLSHNDC